MFSPIASSAKKIAEGPISAAMPLVSRFETSIICSSDPRAATEQALRPDHQDDDEYRKSPQVLEVDRDNLGGNLHQHPDDQAAHQRAVGGAQAAQDHSGEHQQQQREAHLVLDRASQLRQAK